MLWLIGFLVAWLLNLIVLFIPYVSEWQEMGRAVEEKEEVLKEDLEKG